MSHAVLRLLMLAGALCAGGCASLRTPATAAAAPNLAPWPGTPAPMRGKLYADCLAQSVAVGAYDRLDDHGGHLLRFRCVGSPAVALFAELGPWSAARRSEWRADGRVFRSTARVVRDLFGVDYCSSDGATAECDLTLNVGDFLGPPGEPARP